MSIESELIRIKLAKEDIKNSIILKGVEISDSDTIDSYADKLSLILQALPLIVKTRITETSRYGIALQYLDTTFLESCGGKICRVYDDYIWEYWPTAKINDKYVLPIGDTNDVGKDATCYYYTGVLPPINISWYEGGGYINHITSSSFTYTVPAEFFPSNKTLIEASLPNVEIIENSAFKDNSGLEIISMPKVITIGNYVFSGCSKLSNITIGNSLLRVGTGAFSGIASTGNLYMSSGSSFIEDATFLTNFSGWNLYVDNVFIKVI